MFSRKKKTIDYDRENKIAVLRCSICTGEQVAGFKDIRTGKFEDVMLIKTPRDLEDFKRKYNIETVIKEY